VIRSRQIGSATEWLSATVVIEQDPLAVVGGEGSVLDLAGLGEGVRR
jgi:hypothetical protein